METKDTTSRYIILKDGNGMEYKFVNFNNPEICPRQGIVEIEALRDKNFRKDSDFSLSIGTPVDPDGVIWAIPTGVNKADGSFKFQRIMLKANTFFDRNIDNQAKMCAIVMHSQHVMGSPLLKGRPKFKVRNKEEQAKKGLDKKKLSVDAYAIASKLFGDELRDIASTIGYPVDNQSETIISNQVTDYAFNSPEDFLKIWNDPNRNYLTILKKAVSVGVVENNLALGYLYNGLNLGRTESHAVLYLRDKPDLAVAIDTITKERKEAAARAMATPSYMKLDNIAPIKEEAKDSELQNQVKELMEQNKKLMEMLMVGKSENLSTEVVKTEDEEMVALRKKANELKIKGANLPKMSKEKLSALIAEAEGMPS